MELIGFCTFDRRSSPPLASGADSASASRRQLRPGRPQSVSKTTKITIPKGFTFTRLSPFSARYFLTPFQHLHPRYKMQQCAGLSSTLSTSSIRSLWFLRYQGMNNLLLEFPDKGAVLIDPGFGFRRFGPGPVLQCIDAGIVVFTQVKKLGIFRHEKIYAMLFVRKSLSNMACFILHRSFSRLGFWN